MIGDNKNARDWASERMNTSGNIFFDRRYWTVREQVKQCKEEFRLKAVDLYSRSSEVKAGLVEMICAISG
jgi:hypothetical protein